MVTRMSILKGMIDGTQVLHVLGQHLPANCGPDLNELTVQLKLHCKGSLCGTLKARRDLLIGPCNTYMSKLTDDLAALKKSQVLIADANDDVDSNSDSDADDEEEEKRGARIIAISVKVTLDTETLWPKNAFPELMDWLGKTFVGILRKNHPSLVLDNIFEIFACVGDCVAFALDLADVDLTRLAKINMKTAYLKKVFATGLLETTRILARNEISLDLIKTSTSTCETKLASVMTSTIALGVSINEIKSSSTAQASALNTTIQTSSDALGVKIGLSLTETMAVNRKELLEQAHVHAQRIQKMSDDHKQQVEALSAKVATTIAEAATVSAAVATTHAQQIQTTSDDHKQQVEALSAKVAKTIAEAATAYAVVASVHAQQIQTMTANHNAQVEALSAKIAATIAGAADKMDAKVDNLIYEANHKIEALRKQLDEAKNSVHAKNLAIAVLKCKISSLDKHPTANKKPSHDRVSPHKIVVKRHRSRSPAREPSKKSRSSPSLFCKFYDTCKGCRDGSRCTFKH